MSPFSPYKKKIVSMQEYIQFYSQQTSVQNIS